MELAAVVLGWVGAVLLVGAYALLAARRLAPGLLYHCMNIAGAAGLAFNCAVNGAWPSTALNVMWLVIGAITIARRRSTEAVTAAGSAHDERR
ncbi:MAG TPA: hypothetical protein VIC82_14020 [Candidatus Nanopelagicales bacterium]|jgi:hypothetical protein